MLVTGFPAGALQANCYVLAPHAGGECVVVDPGQHVAAPLTALLVEHRLTPVAVLLTHGHFDHVFSAAQVCAEHGVPAFVHPADRGLLTDPLRGMSPESAVMFGQAFGDRIALREPDEVRELTDGAVLELAGLTATVIHTPGHTAGSVVFTVPVTDAAGERTEVILAGDTLFAGSVGRTDLPGGDPGQLAESLRLLAGRDDSGVVLPGHGPTTTIGRERAANPFLAELSVPAPGRTR